MSDDVPDSRPIAATAMILFFAIAVLIAWDLTNDYIEGASWPHLGIELLVLCASAFGIGLLWHQLNRTRQGLGAALAEAEQWRNENRQLLLGLGVAIRDQFDRWRLSKAEAEVGLLLLKGLSHKEIGKVRRTSERTAREQARALYRKSELSGRPALSSFFLEDLLPPPEEATSE